MVCPRIFERLVIWPQKSPLSLSQDEGSRSQHDLWHHCASTAMQYKLYHPKQICYEQVHALCSLASTGASNHHFRSIHEPLSHFLGKM